MAPGVYDTDTGIVKYQYTKDDVTYVEFNVPVNAQSVADVTISKTGDLTTGASTEDTSSPTNASSPYEFSIALFIVLQILRIFFPMLIFISLNNYLFCLSYIKAQLNVRKSFKYYSIIRVT